MKVRHACASLPHLYLRHKGILVVWSAPWVDYYTMGPWAQTCRRSPHLSYRGAGDTDSIVIFCLFVFCLFVVLCLFVFVTNSQWPACVSLLLQSPWHFGPLGLCLVGLYSNPSIVSTEFEIYCVCKCVCMSVKPKANFHEWIIQKSILFYWMHFYFSSNRFAWTLCL